MFSVLSYNRKRPGGQVLPWLFGLRKREQAVAKDEAVQGGCDVPDCQESSEEGDREGLDWT